MEAIKVIREEIETRELGLIKAKKSLDETILKVIENKNDLTFPFAFKDKMISSIIVENCKLKGRFLKKDGTESLTCVVIPVNENYEIVY